MLHTIEAIAPPAIADRHLRTVRQALTTALDLIGPAQVLQLLADELEARSVDAVEDTFKNASDTAVRTIVQRHEGRILAALDVLTAPST
jgi:hypothetical protein